MLIETQNEIVNRKIKTLEADIKEGRLDAANSVYEDIIFHIKSMWFNKKIKENFYLSINYATLRKQTSDEYHRMVKKITK